MIFHWLPTQLQISRSPPPAISGVSLCPKNGILMGILGGRRRRGKIVALNGQIALSVC